MTDRFLSFFFLSCQFDNDNDDPQFGIKRELGIEEKIRLNQKLLTRRECASCVH